MTRQLGADIPRTLFNQQTQLGKLIAGTLFIGDQGANSSDYAQALQRLSAQPTSSVAVYVHLPFCPVRCLNCSNNTTVTHDHGVIDRYLDNLEIEIRSVMDHLGGPRHLEQLRLGGGTPNYLSDTQLVHLMDIIGRYFDLDGQTEATLEANPCRTSASQLALLRGLGFNGIDFGVRDLDAQVQAAIGRIQSFELMQDTVMIARGLGFRAINMDLVYGLPFQSSASLEKTVQRLGLLNPDRIYCMPYHHQPDQLAHQRAMDGDIAKSLADRLCLFNTVVEGLTATGYDWIGLDCFARPNDDLALAQSELRLWHDWLGYTACRTRDFLGFGVNSISESDGLCVQNHLEIPNWQSALASNSLPVRGGFQLSSEQRRRRDALTGLLCNMETPDSDALMSLRPVDDSPNPWQEYLQRGLIDIEPNRLRVTHTGRHLLHHVWNDLGRRHRNAGPTPGAWMPN